MQAFTTLKTALRPEHAYVAGTCCTSIASRREYRCVITVDLSIGLTRGFDFMGLDNPSVCHNAYYNAHTGRQDWQSDCGQYAIGGCDPAAHHPRC